jgi:signal peptidase I
VVFNRPEEGGRRYVKRVIAAGPAGETDAPTSVVFEKGRVFVNNQLLDEPYLTPEERDSPLEFQATLTEGQYFVLGDHRSVSKDSLRFGPIAENQVIGKAFLRIWPLGKAGLL